MATRRDRDDRARVLTGAALLLAAVTVHAYLTHGLGEQAVRLIIRQTARISLLSFCAAFAASSLLRLKPGPATRWMMRNRRWLGITFAMSHLLHLVAILRLNAIAPDFEVDGPTLIFGGLAYVVIAALSATSFDGAVRKLGARNWGRMHKIGMYYIWLVFSFSYFPRAAADPAYIPAGTILGATIAVRGLARKRRAPA